MPLNIQDLSIQSSDITPHETIDRRFVADGENAIPALEITGVPANAQELAIIVHDPDAPLPQGFTHLTLYGIAAKDQQLDVANARFGPHGGGEPAYTGPEPPFGHGRHHYYFWVYALDTKVDGAPSREEFLERYAGNIVEQNRFVAHYER